MKELFADQSNMFIEISTIRSGDAAISFRRKLVFEYPINMVFIRFFNYGMSNVIGAKLN
ncbi:MAG: hypothetical protein ACXAAH_17385 [Promethearchaeota archaeon]|jgi:hypothetical protein